VLFEYQLRETGAVDPFFGVVAAPFVADTEVLAGIFDDFLCEGHLLPDPKGLADEDPVGTEICLVGTDEVVQPHFETACQCQRTVTGADDIGLCGAVVGGDFDGLADLQGRMIAECFVGFEEFLDGHGMAAGDGVEGISPLDNMGTEAFARQHRDSHCNPKYVFHSCSTLNNYKRDYNGDELIINKQKVNSG